MASMSTLLMAILIPAMLMLETPPFYISTQATRCTSRRGMAGPWMCTEPPIKSMPRSPGPCWPPSNTTLTVHKNRLYNSRPLILLDRYLFLSHHLFCFADSRSENSFSVGLSHHFSGTNLIFDRVFSNRGGGYSPVTGHFTAKESGVYVFHFHALSRSDTEVWTELYHNYHYIDSLYGRSNGEFAAGSNAAVLDLVAGDTVFLKSRQSSNSYFGTTDQVYCTFSGYKLELEEEPSIGNPGEIIG